MFQPLTAQRKAARASVAMMAVCLLLLQVVIAGLGIGSPAPGEESGAFFGVTCASKQATGIDGGPISPTSPLHQHGLCCILHDGTLAEPGARDVVVAVLAHSETEAPQGREGSVDAIRIAPERAPSSPRPPPVRGV